MTQSNNKQRPSVSSFVSSQAPQLAPTGSVGPAGGHNKDILKAHLKSILLRHEGCTNPITSQELTRLLRKNDRVIRLLIRELITEGLPIASNTEPPAGYFLITSFNEVNKYSQSIRGRLIKDAIRRRDFKKAATLYLQQSTQAKLF